MRPEESHDAETKDSVIADAFAILEEAAKLHELPLGSERDAETDKVSHRAFAILNRREALNNED